MNLPPVRWFSGPQITAPTPITVCLSNATREETPDAKGFNHTLEKCTRMSHTILFHASDSQYSHSNS